MELTSILYELAQRDEIFRDVNVVRIRQNQGRISIRCVKTHAKATPPGRGFVAFAIKPRDFKRGVLIMNRG